MTNWFLGIGLLPDTFNYGSRMHRECRERFPSHRGLAIPTCIAASTWGVACVSFLFRLWYFITLSIENRVFNDKVRILMGLVCITRLDVHVTYVTKVDRCPISALPLLRLGCYGIIQSILVDTLIPCVIKSSTARVLTGNSRKVLYSMSLWSNGMGFKYILVLL